MTTFHASSRPKPLFVALEFDRFSAQVAEAWDSRLSKSPFVVIEQNADSHKTVVLACSRPALLRGIRPGMPLFAAERRTPALQVVVRNKAQEEDTIELLKRTYEKMTPEFTVRTYGASLLNLSGTPLTRNSSYDAIPLPLVQTLKKSTGLIDIAVGLASTRLLSRLLARMARPCHIRCCKPETEQAVLRTMEVQLLPGLGALTRDAFSRYGIHTVDQLQRLPKASLGSHFGKDAERLHALIGGLDLEKRLEPPPPLCSRTLLPNDDNDEQTLAAKLSRTADELCFLLRKQQASAKHFTLILTYSDGRRAQKSFACESATHDFLVVTRAAQTVFPELYKRRVALKTMELQVKRVATDTAQLPLFESAGAVKREKLGDALTRIRERLSFSAVLTATHMESCRS